jgi:hypothetical protein
MIIALLVLLFGVTVVLAFIEIPRIRRLAKDFREMTKDDASS